MIDQKVKKLQPPKLPMLDSVLSKDNDTRENSESELFSDSFVSDHDESQTFIKEISDEKNASPQSTTSEITDQKNKETHDKRKVMSLQYIQQIQINDNEAP